MKGQNSRPPPPPGLYSEILNVWESGLGGELDNLTGISVVNLLPQIPFLLGMYESLFLRENLTLGSSHLNWENTELGGHASWALILHALYCFRRSCLL